MSIENFIPTVWSENLLHSLNRKYIAVANCTREFEGEIKEKGSVVRICGLSPITVSNYKKNQDISAPEALNGENRDLVINQAKYFNFQIDDIDRTQSNAKLMEYAVKSAGDALANMADKYVYQTIFGEVCNINFGETSDTQIIDQLLDARTELLKKGYADPNDLVLEVTPQIAAHIFKAKVATVGNNGEILENGCVGSIFGCKIFVSNNLPMSQVTDDAGTHTCYLRTRRAVAFAEQFSEVEAYRPELRFADAIKGLHLYGAKVIYPDEILALSFNMPF